MKTFGSNEEKIYKSATRTLDLNTLKMDTGNKAIYAGGNQFRTLWVRDFCYSVEGLVLDGQNTLVKYQLSLIFSFLSREGLLPRGLDFISPKWRVVQNTILKWLPLFRNQYPTAESEFKRIIKAEYFGEHGTPAMDSNALFVLAYCNYADKNKDWFLSDTQLLSLLDYYNRHRTGDLFDQPPFSDWQDSVLRTGPLALLQLQILSAYESSVTLKRLPESHFNIKTFKNKILESFFDPNSYLFYQDTSKKRLSLDCYGFIFRYGLFSDVIDLKRLYLSLKASALWQHIGGPGVPVFPKYQETEVSWTTKMVGLRHYHDGFHWGWLIAEAAYIAKTNSDINEYQHIVDRYSACFQPDQNLAEIYIASGNQLTEYSGLFYRSENPFTWTAAKWLAALNISVNKKNDT